MKRFKQIKSYIYYYFFYCCCYCNMNMCVLYSIVYSIVTAPPLQSDVTTQVEFYKALCSRLGVVPITSYKRSLDQDVCTLHYSNINDSDSKALSLPLQV